MILTRALRDFFIGGFDWNGVSGRWTVLVGMATAGLIILLGAPLSGLTNGALSPIQVIFVLFAPFCVQAYGTMVRRLHDAGRSGVWVVLFGLPYGLILLPLALLALPRKPDAPQRRKPTLLRRIGFAAACVLALTYASRAFWTGHLIINEAMAPTLQVGDYVGATTLFGHPRRGDIVIYSLDAPGDPLQIMRVVALEGEEVSIGPDGLSIDGVPVENSDSQETLPGGLTHLVVPATATAEEVQSTEVPQDHIFVLVDNRTLEDTLSNPGTMEARLVPLERTRSRVLRIIASSESWQAGILRWGRDMRWDRVWSRPI
ncbi:signal peptidase I [Pelagovum pacificum]|uniref:Signal peptidase I n=1 Tax=Pelagovum pacificum TaxID=2588711 RepID=A0A5C5GFR4_9RHOB|nr:signal peptidase I [Pelagovum pacificum]QQA43270.1 signal peptidase I [Pelagovum pacificum]TNY33592.1 signal peptidase I [Pelagovum pacificum]